MQAWRVALTRDRGPVALVLSRQDLPIIDRNIYAEASNLRKGAYVLCDPEDGEPEVIIIATGSEVSLAMEGKALLDNKGIKSRVVSMPSWELFEEQPETYKNTVLPPHIKARVAIETGISQGWHKYAGDSGRIIAQDRFGASAPYKVLVEKFGFTPGRVVDEALKAIADAKSRP